MWRTNKTVGAGSRVNRQRPFGRMTVESIRSGPKTKFIDKRTGRIRLANVIGGLKRPRWPICRLWVQVQRLVVVVVVVGGRRT
jgi:hypothetical protein